MAVAISMPPTAQLTVATDNLMTGKHSGRNIARDKEKCCQVVVCSHNLAVPLSDTSQQLSSYQPAYHSVN